MAGTLIHSLIFCKRANTLSQSLLSLTHTHTHTSKLYQHFTIALSSSLLSPLTEGMATYLYGQRRQAK